MKYIRKKTIKPKIAIFEKNVGALDPPRPFWIFLKLCYSWTAQNVTLQIDYVVKTWYESAILKAGFSEILYVYVLLELHAYKKKVSEINPCSKSVPRKYLAVERRATTELERVRSPVSAGMLVYLLTPCMYCHECDLATKDQSELYITFLTNINSVTFLSYFLYVPALVFQNV